MDQQASKSKSSCHHSEMSRLRDSSNGYTVDRKRGGSHIRAIIGHDAARRLKNVCIRADQCGEIRGRIRQGGADRGREARQLHINIDS